MKYSSGVITDKIMNFIIHLNFLYASWDRFYCQ